MYWIIKLLLALVAVYNAKYEAPFQSSDLRIYLIASRI
jgi:hypothetical protein